MFQNKYSTQGILYIRAAFTKYIFDMHGTWDILNINNASTSVTFCQKFCSYFTIQLLHLLSVILVNVLVA